MISETSGTDFHSVVILRITHGPTAGLELRFFDHQTCIVGRSRSAHLRLSPNPEFSRFHCRLELNPPEVVIVDLGSTNGTKVNGKRTETAALKSGDEVTVGDVMFRVTILCPSHPSNELSPTIIGPRQSSHSVDQSDSIDEPLPEIPGYVIERQIGQGSMGSVYLARRISTNTAVAVKVVRPLVAKDQKALDRFQREASIVLRLQHKRIVKSLDFRLTDQGLPYLVMEYINEVKPEDFLPDVSLIERCRMVAGIVARALEGLQYAHDMEIVHRDLKPSNLLFFREGRKLQVKLADFGIAKNFVDAGFSNCSTSNEICGTLAYMPPEQIVDCRYAKPSCDIYAAGVCLYKLISDRVPFEADQVAQQISLILNTSPIPIRNYVADVPTSLVTIIDRALARDASKRFPSAEAMRQALLPLTKRF